MKNTAYKKKRIHICSVFDGPSNMYMVKVHAKATVSHHVCGMSDKASPVLLSCRILGWR